jgi:hypothetical protein
VPTNESMPCMLESLDVGGEIAYENLSVSTFPKVPIVHEDEVVEALITKDGRAGKLMEVTMVHLWGNDDADESP